MPIVDIEVVTDASEPAARKEQLQSLADELGDLFGSDPGDTWIRLRSIDRRGYAENRTLIDGSVRPTFVSVLRYELPDAVELRREMAGIAEAVARILDRPRENVHVLYSPGAKGRIGFGGELKE